MHVPGGPRARYQRRLTIIIITIILYYISTCLTYMLYLLSIFRLTPQGPQNQSTPIILLDSSTSSSATRSREIPGGSEHPLWSHPYQRGTPAGDHHTSRDDHSQGFSLPSTVGSDYEDSDSRRARSRQERRKRHEMNMNRPNNTMYRAIKEDQKKKRTEKRKKRQETRQANSKRGRGGGHGGGGRGTCQTSTPVTSTGSTTVNN